MNSLFNYPQFKIEIRDVVVTITEHTVKDQQVFRLVFSDDRAPLILSRAKTWNGEIWTSIPQGRQKEAEEFGREICKHLKTL
ncbi:hypothetical protein AB3466_11130 [Sphingobacterium thalpophilum]|uniref:hypothetical protein n=1 Tax=Sphingobacterium thalpophilum TaxID=259 RepID=UPI0037D9B8D6